VGDKLRLNEKFDQGFRRPMPKPLSRVRTKIPIVVLVTLLALGGCAPQPGGRESSSEPVAGPRAPLAELVVPSSPRTLTGPSTAVLEATAIAPITEASPAQLPVTVVSHDLDGDKPVTVTSTDRILGLDLTGSIAATIFGLGLGDSVVGRDISTTFPNAAQLPIVTSSGHTINSEAILALRPTVLITDGTIGPIDVVLQLRDAGIAVVFVKPEPSIRGVSDLALQVATALGVPSSGTLLADRLATELKSKIAEIAAIAPENEASRVRILFLYLRGASGIYYLFGTESGADALITSLGGIDVAGEIGWNGMKPMTDEALVAANPDLILVMTDGLKSVGEVSGLLESKPAIALTNAGKNRRFVDMADGEILSFGPRTAGVLDALARAIYAPNS
jgi:iron complex transport system substrate-binding protein